MSKIQEIHESGLYGVIVETGCGAAVTSKLTSVPGASQTIYKSLIPYSKEYEEKLYGRTSRSVSMEFVNNVLHVESVDLSPKVNFILATSWQLSDGDQNKYTHGWVGIKKTKTGEVRFFHFSFDRGYFDPNDREFLLDTIGRQMINLLHIYAYEADHVVLLPGVMLDESYRRNEYSIDYKFLINTLERDDRDYPLCFSSNKKTCRFEDLMRSADSFIVSKGSYSPIHHQHVAMMNATKSLHPEAEAVFLISTFRYDKPHIEVNDLVERIERINSLGYPVIIMKSVYFYDTFDILQSMSNDQKKFLFPVGFDTIDRVVGTDIKKFNIVKEFDDYVDSKVALYKDNFRFVVLPRTGYRLPAAVERYNDIIEYVTDFQDDGISSTKIRSGEMKNKLDSL